MKEEIVDKYSIVDTLDMCMEESGELVHALNKYKRASGLGYETKTSENDALLRLTQAIADAQNAINSVMYVIGINDEEIKTEITRADERLMELLKINDEIEKTAEKQAKNEFHSEKCGIKNNDAYPETYWIEEEIGGDTIIRKPFIPKSTRRPFIPKSTRRPFIPCNGQLYYYVNADRIVSATCFLGSIEDKLKIAIGNCFKTSEQAQANVDIIMKRLKDDWNVWARLDELQPQSTQRENCSSENNNTHDAVNHPSHYCTGGIECIDVIKATSQGMDGIEAFCHGNAMKYLFRWKQKNGLEDLKKARWYIDRLIKMKEGSSNEK